MSNSKIRDHRQSPGSGEGPTARTPSMCGESTMRSMAAACGCGPTTAERAPAQQQPSGPIDASAAGCRGGGDTDVVAGPVPHDQAVA